ncbi:OmpA family protein [Quatrionicoccus australiensis]|uniref:OmpA family protein n=1 Tax=Quatrionicoccus australiensis TaxID=138118 RepID=UPI001CFA5AD0|nr:OmpA family protein [Quatrionicoccus australiensis]MCB4361055.1 OmpA family protein [Quatrionicoccus australiensis]
MNLRSLVRPVSTLAAMAAILLLAACATTPPPAPRVTLAVAQVERGVMVWLPDSVLFEFGKSALDLNAAGPYLDRVAQLLKEKSTSDILLEGHTDNIGNAAANLTLSQRRADVVRDALLVRGVPEARMKVVGLGLSQPLAPNDTETGRKLNRRVELILLGERLENLKRGEPDNAFEEAFDRLKRLLEQPQGKS